MAIQFVVGGRQGDDTFDSDRLELVLKHQILKSLP